MRRALAAVSIMAGLATGTAAAAPGQPKEAVEADVSTRSVAITSSFTGTEILIFGTVENSKQPTAEAGYYDIAVVIEGPGEALIARLRLSRCAPMAKRWTSSRNR